MSIQIQRQKSPIMYKISEYNQRQILWRKNRHGERWQRYQDYETPELARQAILQLEKEAKK